MVERLKDGEDLRLEALFAVDAIADNGFSRKAMSRVRRRIWVQRLALPVAFVVGGAIAIKPLSHLIVALTRLLALVPQNLKSNIGSIPFENLPPVSSLVTVAFAVMALIFAGKLLQD